MNIKINKNTKTPEIEAALFDLDGTLLNSKEQIPVSIQNKIKKISYAGPLLSTRNSSTNNNFYQYKPRKTEDFFTF